ncbi:MAG: sugar ABC transporter substrate-binding protein [Thermomicrobiales bacterium]
MTRSRAFGDAAFTTLQQHVTRRILLRGSAAGAAGLGIAALGGATGRQSASAAQDAICNGEQAHLTYGFWDAAQKPGVDAQIAAFTAKHPNISIETQIVPWSDYWTKLQTGVAGGSTYDVFWLNAANVPTYASQGALVSLQDLVDDETIDVSGYPESLRSLYTYEDKAYGIPRDFDTIALYYNKDLFDKAGVEYPTADWTWDDLHAAAEKLTVKEGDSASQWGYAAGMNGQQNWYNLVWQNGGVLFNEDQTETMLGEEPACEALLFAGDMVTEGLSPSVAIMQANDPHEKLFPAGVIAMISGGSWYARTYAEALPNVAVSPLPKQKNQATAIHGLANVIWTGSQQQCAALEWVKFLASAEAEQLLADTATVIPALEGMQDSWLASVPSLDLQVFLDAVDYSYAVPNPLAGNEWEDNVVEVLAEAWSGGIPREEICAKVVEAATAGLQA